ncbi:MAG: EAL domain-containing protein [Rubellimicrobium sp.]|nr:EAL domain-containing protein [Rubellimicrobium sp.]
MHAARPADDDPTDPLSHALHLQAQDLPALVASALAAGRVRLAFQPVVMADDPARIAFHEGFVRLVDPAGRLLPAASFIAGVQDRAEGRDIDTAALRLGLAALRDNPALRLAINMSARSIGDDGWRAALDDGLAAAPDTGARLILEISESSAMTLPEIVARFMAAMQPQGISFALDDFGDGFLSFRHLRDFYFDMVKIAPGFVQGIDTSPDNQVVVEALVAVARQFGMFTIAEGVETAADRDRLARMGVDCLQGYLFGRPRPAP